MLAVLQNPGTFERLNANKFRRNFFLSFFDISHIDEFGIEEMKNLSYNLVNKNLRKKGFNNCHEIPHEGNPVFKALHATGTCCRKCLFKWHRIPPFRDLTENEVNYIVRIQMKWILKEYNQRKVYK